MTTDNIKKIILLIVLILVFGIIQLFIKNNIIAISLLSLMVIGILIYLKRSNATSIRQKNKIIQHGKRVKAHILSVKTVNHNSIILSLLVEHPEKFYVTSYITNSYMMTRESYKKDQQITVFVNPINQYEVIIPETKKETNPAPKTAFWGVFTTVGIIALSFGIPLFVALFDTSEREFKDITIIQSNKQEYIWEIRFESPKKVFFKIYNPITNEKIKSFKDKKDIKLDHYTNFFISQQELKVYIIGTGNTPVIDVYDAVTLEKVSDIEKFEQSDKILRKGIASIHFETPNNRLTKDNVITITTNDGNKCFYNIQQNEFYYSEKELKDYFEESDYALLSKQMFVFVQSNIPNSVNKHQLYIIETNNKKGIEYLQRHAGSINLDVDYFNKNRKYSFKYCNLIPLCPENYFLEGKFLYFDASIAIIQHVTAINDTADELITGINKSGKTLFAINQSDYPNIKDMTENNHKPNYNNKLKVIRNSNKIYLLFDKNGAMCMDINTGKILWKYEP